MLYAGMLSALCASPQTKTETVFTSSPSPSSLIKAAVGGFIYGSALAAGSFSINVLLMEQIMSEKIVLLFFFLFRAHTEDERERRAGR